MKVHAVYMTSGTQFREEPEWGLGMPRMFFAFSETKRSGFARADLTPEYVIRINKSIRNK